MLCMVDGEGLQIAGTWKRSSEITTHLALYRGAPTAKAVCHAHPVHATAFAVAGFEPLLHLEQFSIGFHLNAQMVQARLGATLGNGEVHSRIIEHPFGVVGLAHRGLGGEQRGVEADGVVERGHADVDMKAFHGVMSSGREREAGVQ